MKQVAWFALIWAVAAAGQSFDAASVKLVPATAGGGAMAKLPARGALVPRRAGAVSGRSDPGRVSYAQISVKDLMRRAYPDFFEIRGPGWMDETFVSVEATMPPDTTPEQLNAMLRNLIVERFGLVFHTENPGLNGYVLVVAKGGPKLKPTAPPVETPAAQDGFSTPAFLRGRAAVGPDGFAVPRSLPTNGFLIQSQPGEQARMSGGSKTMDDFAAELSRQMKTKVVNSTGLTAKYDITITYAGTLAGPRLAPSATDDAQAAEPLPDIFHALESQLGLKLEAKKIPVPVMVVDQMEKTPKEN